MKTVRNIYRLTVTMIVAVSILSLGFRQSHAEPLMLTGSVLEQYALLPTDRIVQIGDSLRVVRMDGTSVTYSPKTVVNREGRVITYTPVVVTHSNGSRSVWLWIAAGAAVLILGGCAVYKLSKIKIPPVQTNSAPADVSIPIPPGTTVATTTRSLRPSGMVAWPQSADQTLPEKEFEVLEAKDIPLANGYIDDNNSGTNSPYVLFHEYALTGTQSTTNMNDPNAWTTCKAYAWFSVLGMKSVVFDGQGVPMVTNYSPFRDGQFGSTNTVLPFGFYPDTAIAYKFYRGPRE